MTDEKKPSKNRQRGRKIHKRKGNRKKEGESEEKRYYIARKRGTIKKCL